MKTCPLCENGHCIIDRVARHKVCETATSVQLQRPDRWQPYAGSRSLTSATNEQALRGARAARAAVRRKSRRRYRIDDGEALLRRRLAQEEPAQGPGAPCRRSPLLGLPPLLKLGDRLPLERLARFECRLDSRTHVTHVRATVKTAMETRQRREREAIPRSKRRASHRRATKKFLHGPLIILYSTY